MITKKQIIPMKKLSYVFMIVLAAFAIEGCNNPQKDAKQSADSVNKTKDTTTNAASTGGISVAADDAKFATTAAAGGMAEVEIGKLAEQKTTDAQIKNFATMMVTDHGKANAALMDIAKTKNITLPATLDADHQKKMDDLSKLSGKDFDKAYVDAMVDGHKKTLDLMQDEAKNGKDADLKAFATNTAPTVQMHLDAINKIHASMK
jgi:putative membrane protein